jgi:drug/metabolite transporter (DMT)-like permease
MPPEAIAAALFSALIHAGWNALLKAGQDRLVDMGVMGVGGCLFGLAIVAVAGPPAAGAWPFLAVSSVVHLIYWTALSRGYAAGDMSHVYTIARGSAPALVTIAAIFTARELPGPLAGAGIAIVSLGIMAVGVNPQAPLRATAWALLTGASIATYSLVDALGARVSEDALTYIGWSSLGTFIPITLFAVARRGPSRFLAAAQGRWLQGMSAGALSNAGFGIVLWAQMRAPIGYVTALRETSVVFGAAIAALLLKERVTPRRWAGALAVAVGALMIGFARA